MSVEKDTPGCKLHQDSPARNVLFFACVDTLVTYFMKAHSFLNSVVNMMRSNPSIRRSLFLNY